MNAIRYSRPTEEEGLLLNEKEEALEAAAFPFSLGLLHIPLQPGQQIDVYSTFPLDLLIISLRVLRKMTSIAASPAYPEGLKKRSRLLSPESYELPRMKRFRGTAEGDDTTTGATTGGSTASDVLKYTQRHVDYFEQVKQGEIARIRAEYEQYIMKKDVEFQRCRQELMHAHERTIVQEKEVERLQGENKLLKRAIAIQNQQKEECQEENTMLKGLATQAAEHIKRLEQTNYALRVHLQTSTSTGVDHSQPPNVF